MSLIRLYELWVEFLLLCTSCLYTSSGNHNNVVDVQNDTSFYLCPRVCGHTVKWSVCTEKAIFFKTVATKDKIYEDTSITDVRCICCSSPKSAIRSIRRHGDRWRNSTCLSTISGSTSSCQNKCVTGTLIKMLSSELR